MQVGRIERVPVSAVISGVGDLLDSRVIDGYGVGDGRSIRPHHRDVEFRGRIQDRGIIQTHTVHVVVNDVQIVEVVDTDDGRGHRLCQIGSRRPQ